MSGATSTLLFRLLGDSDSAEQAFDNVDSRAEESGKNMEKFGAAAAVAGAAAGALMVASFASAMEQEQATDILAAQLGADGAWATQLGDMAGDLYGQAYGESITDASDAIKATMQNSLAPVGAAKEEVEGLAKSAMNLSTVFGEDVTASTAAAAQMVRTGLAANSAEAFDIITAGFQSGVNKSEDFLDTLNEYSTQWRRLGLDGETAIGLLNQGLKAGARDADQVADALGQFGERALAGGTAVDDAYKSIGLSSKDMAAKLGAGGDQATMALSQTLNALRGTKDEQVKLNAAVALFGDPAAVMGDALFALDPATATLENVAGAAKKLDGTITDNPAAKIEQFKRAALQAMTEMAGGALTWAEDNKGAVAGISASLGSLLVILGAIKLGMMAYTAYQTIMTGATAVVTAAQWLWNAALTANPIGVIIMLIVALVAGLIWFFTQTELGRQIISVAMAAISTAFQWVWTKVQQLWEWVKGNWPLLLAIFTGPIGLAVKFIMDNWDKIVTYVKALPGRIAASASGMWTSIWTGFRGIINNIIRAWNSLHFSVPSFSFAGITTPGFNLGLPQLPLMKDGGIVTGPTALIAGEAGDEAIVPLDRMGDMGTTVHVHVHVGAVGSESFLADTISEAVARVTRQGSGTNTFGLAGAQ